MMDLKVSAWILMFTLLCTNSWGISSLQLDKKYLTIKKIEVKEVSTETLSEEKIDALYRQQLDVPFYFTKIVPAEKIIKLGRELVALGEDIYRLVDKGRPTSVTHYAPINVLPLVDGRPIDILDTENWNMPVKRTYEVLYENLYGMDVVKFRYSVVYSYGGSYEGKGAYLTAVIVVPESVTTLFGYDFTATMKLVGIQNNGSKADPVAGATVLMEHTVKTVFKASTSVSTFFITGRGNFRRL